MSIFKKITYYWKKYIFYNVDIYYDINYKEFVSILEGKNNCGGFDYDIYKNHDRNKSILIRQKTNVFLILFLFFISMFAFLLVFKWLLDYYSLIVGFIFFLYISILYIRSAGERNIRAIEKCYGFSDKFIRIEYS